MVHVYNAHQDLILVVLQQSVPHVLTAIIK